MTDTERRIGRDPIPSQLPLLLVLLIVAVLLDDLFFAAWMVRISTPSCGVIVTSGCSPDIVAVTGAALRAIQPALGLGLVGYTLTARLRRRGSIPIPDAPYKEAVREITALAIRADVTTMPTVRLGRGLGDRAFVTGTPRAPYLVLGPELLARYAKGDEAREVFRAVVRHELAHLRARDLWSYFLATVLRGCNVYTGAFMLFALVLDHAGGRGSGGDLALAVVRLLALVLITELVARAFLRMREHQADLYAGQEGLAGVIAALGPGRETPQRRSPLPRRHPARQIRLAALVDPGRALATSPGQVFLGASVGGVVLMTLQDMLLRTASPANASATPVVTGLLVGVPLTLFLAFGTWREAWRTRSLVRPATGMAVALFGGLFLGSHVALYTRVSGHGVTGVPFDAWTVLALALATVLLCGWLSALGAAWRRHDPDAVAVGDRFLRFAVPVACLGGGWTFAVAWTWAARMRGVLLGCRTDHTPLPAVCADLGRAGDAVARSMLGGFLFSPVALAVIAVMAASLAVPRLLSRVPVSGSTAHDGPRPGSEPTAPADTP